MKRFLRGLLLVSAVLYPLAVVGLWVALARVGESWWPTTVLLYVPRFVWAVPVPFLALALAIWGPRWLLALQLAAALIVVLPLMGLELHGRPAPSGTPRLRVLSYNVNYGFMSHALLRRQIRDAHADVIALQAFHPRLAPMVAEALADYQVRTDGEFVIASRFPIVTSKTGSGEEPGFMQATLDTPLGLIELFCTHPRSPRTGLEALRGRGLRQGLSNGRVLRGEGADRVLANTELRRRQVDELSAAARAATHPVIIAGDTNLPSLSRFLDEYLGGWQDGFSQVGRGFGYTFPAHRWVPWMRIDRILASAELRFLSFEVGTLRASDHHAVWAELEGRPTR